MKKLPQKLLSNFMEKSQRVHATAQKNVERMPLASFVSRAVRSALSTVIHIKNGLNVREVRMGLAFTLTVIVLIIATLVSFLREPEAQAPEMTDQVMEQSVQYHPFTGTVLESTFASELSVFSVMVENSYDAWPLSGVEDAFLVIEAPVEGSIPRFQAFFTSDMSTREIGPVRSARPYYVDWAHGWDAIYAHVGGSPEALELISDLDVQDVNEFYNGSTFWRSQRRSAPHNVYTSVERLSQHAEEKSFKKQARGFFTFKSPEGEVGEIDTIHYSWFTQASNYDVGWIFEEGRYIRKQGQSIAKSLDGDRYMVDNVLFLETDIRSIDEVDRKRVRTTGEGTAILFQNGSRAEVTWKKASVDEALSFEDTWGNKVTFVPGKTWITITDDLERLTSE